MLLTNAPASVLGDVFLPTDIAGLQLWLRPDVGVLTDGAAQFTAANSEYLSVANNADMRGGATFWRAGWIYLDAVDASMYVMSVRDGTTAGYQISYDTSDDKISFIVNSSGATTAKWGTALSAATWYFVYVEYDGTDAKISINDGTLVTATGSFTAEATAAFHLGADGGATTWNGRQQNFCGGDGVLSAAQQTWLYNSGAGRGYDEVGTGSNPVETSDLKFWHGLNEISGTRVDQHGSNDLTDNATVTSAAGLVESAAVNNSPVSKWEDQSGNGNDAVQTTHANKPIYKTNQINGKAAVDFDDALSHWMDLTGMTVASGDKTIVVAYSPDDAVAAADQYIFDSQTGVLILAHLTAASDIVQYSDGTFRGTKAATSGDQVVTFVLKAASAGEIYRDAVSIESGLTYTARAIGANVALGAIQGGASKHISGPVAEPVLYDSALSAADLTRIHNYFAKYGTI